MEFCLLFLFICVFRCYCCCFLLLIPVDVLVIRDGNDLKIRISSITFPPNSADLAEVTGEKAYQNSRTLARLGEIFEKYGRYTILIEGHANQMKYLDTVAEQLK